jgi:hypothetical protein
MAFQLPGVPNFNVQQPQVPNPLETYEKMLQLRTLMGQQQLLPVQLQQAQQQVQTSTLQNQRIQQEMESEKALQRAVAGGVLNKYMGVDSADGSGFDAAGAYRDLISNNGPILTDHASRMVNSMLEMAKNQAEIAKNLGQAGEAQQNIRAKTLNQLADKFGSINDRPLEQASAALDALKQDLVWNPKAYQGLTQKEMKDLYGTTLDHLPAVEALLGLEGKIAEYHKGQAEATAAQQKVIPPGGVMSPDTAQQVQKDIAVATSPQIQAGKIEVAKAEGAAKAQVQLAMEPLRLQIQQTFANQKDARDKIETSVLKPFQDKMTDVNMARTAISQALDNPVAARAAIFKMVGVAQPTGSHRVLPMEFAAFKYPGGISDQIQQKFNDFLTGEPWTPEIAAAATAFIDGQAQAARTNLSSGVDNVNKLYGTSVGGGLKEGQKPAAGGAAQGFTRIQASDGSIHDIPSGKLGAAKQRDPNLKVMQ